MPALTPYTDEEIASFGIEELGVEDGSSPTVNPDVRGSVATREYLCNWTKRWDVCRFFEGDQDTYFESGVMKISRLVPQRMPGREEFVVTKIVEVTGHAWRDFDPGAPDYEESYPDPPETTEDELKNAWGGPIREYQFTGDTVNKFLCAKIKVQYERVPYEVVDDQHVADESQRFVQFCPGDSDVQYVTQPASTQQYIVNGGTVDPVTGRGTPFPHKVVVPYPVGLTETIYRFRLVLHCWPYQAYGPGSVLYKRIFGDSTHRPYLNSINKTTFWEGAFEAGTVMLEKVSESLDLAQLNGAWKFAWRIELGFAVCPYGWNTSWAFPNTNEWAGAGNQAVRALVGRGDTFHTEATMPDGYSQFPVREFADLFNPGTV